MKKQGGITALELIFVLTIVAILSAFSIIGSGTFLYGFQMRDTVSELVSSMNSARFMAISRHKRYGVFFDTVTIPPSYEVFEDTDKNYTLDSRDKVYSQKRYLPSGYTLSVRFNKPEKGVVVFRENGTAKGGSVCIAGMSKRRRKVIVAIITGRIRVENNC